MVVFKFKYLSFSEKVFSIFNYALLFFLSLIFIYPFWQTIVLAFSSVNAANTIGIKIWPQEISLDPLKYVFSRKSIYIGYMNTIIRTFFGTILTIFVTYCGAYTLARRNLPFKGAITIFVLITMFFSGGLIPSYILMKNLGLINTRLALILPGMTSAWNLLITRNFIASLPVELEEAALIDGAHPLNIVFKIMFPLSKPIIAVLSLWTAVRHWNSWFDALLYCGMPDKLVLQLYLYRLLIASQSSELQELPQITADVTTVSVKSATILVSIFPILCLYPFLQKYFMKGIMIGALKG